MHRPRSGQLQPRSRRRNVAVRAAQAQSNGTKLPMNYYTLLQVRFRLQPSDHNAHLITT